MSDGIRHELVKLNKSVQQIAETLQKWLEWQIEVKIDAQSNDASIEPKRLELDRFTRLCMDFQDRCAEGYYDYTVDEMPNKRALQIAMERCTDVPYVYEFLGVFDDDRGDQCPDYEAFEAWTKFCKEKGIWGKSVEEVNSEK